MLFEELKTELHSRGITQNRKTYEWHGVKVTILLFVMSSVLSSACVHISPLTSPTPSPSGMPAAQLPTPTLKPINPCLDGGTLSARQKPSAFGAAYTPDGLRLYRPRALLDAAVAVDGVEIDKKNALLYYIDEKGILLTARVEEEAVQVLGEVSIDGQQFRGLTDVDAYRMQDGTVRLAYLINSQQASFICLAAAEDGQDFSLLAQLFRLEEPAEWTALSFIQLADRSWLLAVQAGEMVKLWRSPDGIIFIPFNELLLGGEPEFALALRGKVRLYLNDGEVISYTSSDGGEAWFKEKVIQLAPGAGKVAYVPITRLLFYAEGD